MFVFLSKLLPLFFYPLGLSCLLLIGALILIWRKRSRLAAISIILALLVLGISSNAWVALKLNQSLEWQYLPTGELPSAEAIVVLGGGVRPQNSPRPWVEVAEAGDRILYGARLYQAEKAPLLILSGGRIYWKGGGSPEAYDMAEIAQAMGVPADAIAADPLSRNTYENAVNVKQILADRNINRILLVTSATHMPRSMGIFRRQGIDAIPAPTDFGVTEQELTEIGGSKPAIALNLLPQADALQRTTKALKEYLGWLIYRLRGWI